MASAELRLEVHKGLNVVERGISTNGFTFYRKTGEQLETPEETKRSACFACIYCKSVFST